MTWADKPGAVDRLREGIANLIEDDADVEDVMRDIATYAAALVADAVARERERCARVVAELSDESLPVTDWAKGRDAGLREAHACIREGR